MKRSQWLSKPAHSAETTLAESREYRVLIIDSQCRAAEGWGKSEETAFSAAHGIYKAALHRSLLTTKHVAGRALKPVGDA